MLFFPEKKIGKKGWMGAVPRKVKTAIKGPSPPVEVTYTPCEGQSSVMEYSPWAIDCFQCHGTGKANPREDLFEEPDTRVLGYFERKEPCKNCGGRGKIEPYHI